MEAPSLLEELNTFAKHKVVRGVLWGALLLVTAMGFDFQTPKAQFRELRGEITKLHEDRDSLRRNIEDIQVTVRALAAGQCIDRPVRDLQLMGLDCSRYLHSKEK